MLDAELPDNLGLYLTRQTLSLINFVQSLYQMPLPVRGVIMEFGARWGQNMALRGMREPFNYTGSIVGFVTFEGFPKISAEDGRYVRYR